MASISSPSPQDEYEVQTALVLVPSPLEDILRAKRRQLVALRGRIKRGGEFDTVNHYEAVAKEIQAEVEESPDCGGGEQQVLVVGIVGPLDLD